ncbi:tumor necrosis factor receptor superfamily member wengen [Culex quinquefasciatus]|uniref:tumor necrosis factor receptor superfamily member wengen n=1 Tax=Culex quinquefasciatus TaxID=7176 RepID=UPI0018E3A5B5|nr:tumor necrosis factor receptor superfamily member wengen [Culex quinquefasciatus]XP_038104335.1 tumor necrosis factor receptor superfamily member wengen [Culex quinquefasciatus]
MPPRVGSTATMAAVNDDDVATAAILDSRTTSRPAVMYSSHSNSTSSVSLLGLASRRLRWVVAAVTLCTVLSRVDAVCEPDRWWNPERSECVPCRVCDEQQLVMRPCQEYMDTVCGTMKDLDMDLAQLARPEESGDNQQRHWKEERRKDAAHHRFHNGRDQRHQQQQHSQGPSKPENTADIMWDWQAASLLLAIIGCLLFFFAAAIIALNQTRQWKRIEKHFDADMEALSAQLMNHLSSMQQLENGSIFLDDVIGPERFRSGGGGSTSSTSGLLGNSGVHHHHHHHPIEVRCVYLDQLLDGKGCTKQQGPGNLYIEEHQGGGAAPPGNNGPSAGSATTLTTAGRMY